ncbi:MAG: hypothetical protein V1725_03565 [archaeon]
MATQDAFTPINSTGSAVNASNAYDTISTSFAFLNTTMNLTLQQFNTGLLNDSIPIMNASASFDLAVQDVLDDRWALQYTLNGSWQDLRSMATGNLARQTLIYAIPEQLFFSNLTSGAFKLRLITQVQDTEDTASLALYEVFLNVTYDREGPVVTLLSPADGALENESQLVLSYTADDALFGILNCSLYINGSFNQSNTTITEGIPQNFSIGFSQGSYVWNVTCADNSTNENRAGAKNVLTIDLLPPTVTALAPNDTNSTTENVTFNYTATDVGIITNCSIILNDSVVDVHEQVISGQLINAYVSLTNAAYVWNVTCIDSFNRSATSSTLNFVQNINLPPVINTILLPSTIDLIVGMNSTAYCNASVSDPNDISEITLVNGTLYSLETTAGDTSYRAVNSSCALEAQNSTEKNYSCAFSLPYHATAGQWNCTIVALDIYNAVGSEESTVTVNDLYAMNVTPTTIVYGTVSAGKNSSTDSTITVTNLGNREIDVTLNGYAYYIGDDLAMNCTTGNISIVYERYSLLSGRSYGSMTSLTGSPVQVDTFNLTIKNSTFAGTKNIYWKMGVPSLQKGNCSGFVVVSLVAS